MPAAPQLCQGAGISRILQFNGKARRFFDWSFEVDPGPAKVRREDQLVRGEVNSSGQRDANALVGHFRMSLHELADATAKFGHELLGITGRRNRIKGQEA